MNMYNETKLRCTKLEEKVDELENRILEMRHAFDEVKLGREKDLNDAYLTFFAKRRELV